MKDLFHDILKYLNKENGLHKDFLINDFLKEYYGNEIHNSDILQNILRTIQQLEIAGYIERTTRPILGQYGNGSQTNNLDEHRINLKLELEGSKYISEKIRLNRQDELLEIQAASITQTNTSVEKTNTSFQKLNDEVIPFNFKIQKNLTIIIALVSAVSMLVSVATFYKSCEENQLDKSLLLQNNKSALDSLLKIQIKIDSFLVKEVILNASKENDTSESKKR